MGGHPGLAFTPYKGPEIFPTGEDEPGFRAGAGYHSVIGGDLNDPARARAENSLALGDNADAGLDESQSGACALGPNTSAYGDSAFAAGDSAHADGFRATAVGPGTTAAGEGASAFGPGASATGDRAWALGSDAGSAANDTGVLKADHVRIDPSTGPASDLTLYDAAGVAHVLAVTDTEVTFDGTPIGGGGGTASTWHEDEIDVGAGTMSAVLDPTANVVEQSIIVFINGVKQRRDTDWTFDAAAHQITVPALVEGDWVSVNYVTEP